jgi:hypothetical protein
MTINCLLVTSTYLLPTASTFDHVRPYHSTFSRMSNPGESPNVDASAKSPIRMFRFAPDILDLVVDVVDPGSPAREALKQGVDALFSDHWQVMTWSDLKVFTSGDLATALRPGIRSCPPQSLFGRWAT